MQWQFGKVFVITMLAACGAGAPPPDVDPIALPAPVRAALPSDADPRTVIRDPDGCYAYTYAFQLLQVTDAAGNQICLPSG